MSYERQRATARRLIEKAGMTCQWQSRAIETGEGVKPWRDSNVAAPEPVDVPIAWFSPSDVGKGSDVYRAFMQGTEVPAGSEVGLMPGDVEFSPHMADAVFRDGARLTITKIDRLAPSNEPILYYVWIA